MPDRNRRLWLIDAAYMFMSQQAVAPGRLASLEQRVAAGPPYDWLLRS